MSPKKIFSEGKRFFNVSSVFLYALVISVLISIHYNSYKVGSDTAIFNNIFYNSLHGRIGYSSIEGINHFSIHFSPLLLSFLPVYLIAGKWTLGIITFISFLFSASGIFLISKKIFKENKISFLIGLTFLLYAPVAHNIVWDFHENIIALPILIFSFYLLVLDRTLQSLLLFSLAFLVKEEMFLVGIFFGLYIFLFRNKKEGLFFSLISIVGFVSVTKVIMPLFSVSGGHPLWGRYSHLGANYTEVVLGFFKNPQLYLFPPFYVRKLLSLLAFFIPLLFTPLIKISILFTPLITIIYSYISNVPHLDYADHNAISIVPYVFIAYIFSVKYIDDRLKNRTITKNILIIIFIINCIFTAFSFYMRGEFERLKPLSNKDSHIEAISLIPKGKSVFTNYVSSFFVSSRGEIFTGVGGSSTEQITQEYILINFRYVYYFKDWVPDLQKLVFDPNYKPIFFKEDVLLLKRRKHLIDESSQIYEILDGYDVTKYKNYNQYNIVPTWIRWLATKE